jgi:hypothetical protein
MTAMLRVDGSVTFWSLADNTNLDTLKAGLAAIPHPARYDGWASYAPAPRSDNACLKDALSRLYGRKCLVRPLAKRDGFALLKEVPHRDNVEMVNQCSVTVNGAGAIEVLRGWCDGALLRDAMEEERKLVKPAQVTASLVAVLLKDLGAVTLRPSGGIYWVPDASLATWHQVSKAVEGAAATGKSAVYRITHQFDGDSIRAVRDALLDEVLREADRIEREVDQGELGERALKSRANEAQLLGRKVAEYEAILNERLPLAAELTRKAELMATAAKLLAQGAA